VRLASPTSPRTICGTGRRPFKILVGRDRRILGPGVAGHNAGELIDELTLAMNRRLTVDHLVSSIHAYPTYSFGLPIAPHSRRPGRALRLGRLLARFT